MCSTYGVENCYFLRLNSGNGDGMKDIWKKELERKNRGLESGLALARKKILSKSAGSVEVFFLICEVFIFEILCSD